MKILEVRNAHEALPLALAYLREQGVRRDSRNGPVLMSPAPVATVYSHPWERVVFWPERDANPFFHLYEALWMLAGRDDIATLVRYAKNMQSFSDDGVRQRGAYGFRWRKWFGVDQIEAAIERLSRGKNDRRAVIDMWDPVGDIPKAHETKRGFIWDGTEYKDVPCNLTLTLQIDVAGKLQMVVFNRSNDIVWGAYGANSVHMSALQEYVARRLGVEMGTYTQISVNFHAYEKGSAGGEVSEDLWKLADYVVADYVPCGWEYSGNCRPTPIPGDDALILALVDCADRGVLLTSDFPHVAAIAHVLHAHHMYRTTEGEERYAAPMRLLNDFSISIGTHYDWVVAASQWLGRRRARFIAKQGA